MTVPARVEQPNAPNAPKAPPWQARCSACGEWVATVPGGAHWVQAKCLNWRANRDLAKDRKCPLYGKMQTLHRR